MKDIIEFIPYGKENAISQEDLSDVMRCDKRTVRALIFSARTKGAVICSTCEGNGRRLLYTIDSKRGTSLCCYAGTQDKKVRCLH